MGCCQRDRDLPNGQDAHSCRGTGRPDRIELVPSRNPGASHSYRSLSACLPALPASAGSCRRRASRPARWGRRACSRHPRRPAQRRDRRARRPRQDDAGRRHALAVGAFRAGAQVRAGHGLRRPGAGKGHHDPGQEHRGPARRDDHQHHRHAGPRRLRRRGRARPVDGRRRRPARRRQRRPAAADPVRAAQDARGQAAGHPGDQQGRPAGRADRRGGRRLLRAVPGPGRDRGPDRVPDRLRVGPGRPGIAEPAGRRHAARQRRPGAALPGAARDGAGADLRPGAPLRAHVTNLDASSYLGRLALCRVFNGEIRKGQQVAWCRRDGTSSG